MFRFSFSKYIVYSILYIVVCILSVSPGFCQGLEGEFVYDSKGKRDPFVPLITDKARFSMGLIGVETIDDIALEGIVWDPKGNSFAILNGIILKEDEQVNNVKITKIDPKKISLSINENEFTINLIEEEEEK